MTHRALPVLLFLLSLTACGPEGPSRQAWSADADAQGHTAASAATAAANEF